MKGTLTNLNVNPCKMCMPMGAVSALYGIKNCMSILHGSQGCSTYIRRHMATHYNEPVDIASSSLTEEGTVYGGEKNLIQGLLNLIRVYDPEVIGVATTCLAETIGEDIKRMIDNFYTKYPQYTQITIIPVPSPGYGGTQFEGFLEALYQIVKTVPMDNTPNNKVNVITSQLSPADTRYLKNLLEEFEIDYILLPDLSENLDGIYEPTHQKLPGEGTDIRDIRTMAGAKLTLELSTFVGEKKSVARYLYETYGVPYQCCNIPTGLRDFDRLIEILQELSRRKLPDRLKKERGRFLDAMIDSHKYNGEARAVIYGEPDFVYSTVRFCIENGIMPIITATGTKCDKLEELLKEEIQELADSFFIDRFKILDEVDFQTLEELGRELEVNLMIGNSDGRRIAEKLGIKLVRRSFPIHDHIGGQRLRSIGYEGALTLLDEITNSILDIKESGFREELHTKYYLEKLAQPTQLKEDTQGKEETQGKEDTKSKEDTQAKEDIQSKEDTQAKEDNQSREETYVKEDTQVKEETQAQVDSRSKEETQAQEDSRSKEETQAKEDTKSKEDAQSKETSHGEGKSIEEKTASHPCFNCKAHKYARMHLPIAPKCNISCKYCLRKFDCPNESRPGVTTSVLKPEEALQKFLEVKKKVANLSVVGIAGPGDALANFEETRRTLELIREQDLEITFCLSTNGLMLPQYAQVLIDLGVSHVTVTMNAVDPKIGAKIYNYVDYMGVKYHGEEAAAILMANQLAGIKMLTSKGIICKVNIVMLKGVNEHHIPEVVKKVKELGARITNIMPLIPVKGSTFELLSPVSDQELMDMRKQCGETLQQMYHCRQCRADAIGMLDKDQSREFNQVTIPGIQIAVATKSGMLVDQHFGHVSEFYIYEYNNKSIVFKERRPVQKYCSGVEECDTNDNHIEGIIQTISDCRAVIVMRIGDAPKQKLGVKGIKVFIACDRIEDSIENAITQLEKDEKIIFDKMITKFNNLAG